MLVPWIAVEGCGGNRGINAQCHTGETVLMLALKDGQVWIQWLDNGGPEDV